MIIVYGTRFYGKIRAAGSSFLATQFLHIYYVPLIPIGTHLILQENGGGSYKGLKTSFSVTSMLAAYLRVWGPLALLAAVISGIGTVNDLSYDTTAMIAAGVITAIVTFALLTGIVLSWAVIGRLSHDEKQKRAVYALHLGYAVDPADMGDARHSFREGLLAKIAERARGMAAMGYRANADPTVAWPHVALDPTHNDDALVTAAFTLARLDASLSQGPQRQHMDQIHEQLWQRIARSGAPYLNVPA